MNKYQEGSLLMVNKPLNWTSFDIVKKIRNLTNAKTGHAGTLDPLATGLLICCTGKMTKKINEYQAQEKEYIGTLTLGSTTPTYDLESEPVYFGDYKTSNPAQLNAAAATFLGEQLQLPPAYSAVKKKGVRSYKLARQGIEVKREPRKIFIKEFELTNINLPEVGFRVVCSTGTYIRSLADDFGRQVGSGAYLSALCRTRIGNFTLEEALSIKDWEKKIKAE